MRYLLMVYNSEVLKKILSLLTFIDSYSNIKLVKILEWVIINPSRNPVYV